MTPMVQYQPLSVSKRDGLLSAITGHSFVTFRIYIQAVVEDSPYTLSSVVVAAVAIAYLLFVLVLLVLFSS